MEADDGKEFVMLNLVRYNAGQVAHPETGTLSTGPELIQGYFGPFSKALLRRGGHPMRYRSRRDLVALVSDPRFNDGHKFKLAAIDGTISFPMQLRMSTYLRPKIWVPLLLLLLASLGQNLLFLFELRK